MLERPMAKDGRTRVRFDQIATQINDRVDNPAEAGVDRYVGLEHLDPDSLRIRRWGGPTDVESTKLRFLPGDIIFGKRRVYQRKVAVADFEGICSAHAMVLRVKPGAVLPEFLPFFMQSDLFMERALRISVGSLSPTINWTTLASEEFILPSVQEQARLVEVLKAITYCEQSLRTAEHRGRELLDALRVSLIPAPRTIERYMGDVARLSVQRIPVDPRANFNVAGVYSFGRGLIDRGVADGSATKYSHLHRLTEGVLVVSKLKAWEGAVAVATAEHEGALVSPEYPTFELDRAKVLPAFIDQLCRCPWFWHEIQGLCKGTADRRARIHPDDFLKIPIPAFPLSHQETIVRRLLELSLYSNALASRHDEVKAMKKRIIESACTSEMTG